MAYYAVPGNLKAVNAVRDQVIRHWLNALRRRSQKGRRLTWARMNQIHKRWLPPARVMHPFPQAAARRHLPEVRARCGNPARWDPRGDRP
jgi:RNA-directed DNA polymerase